MRSIFILFFVGSFFHAQSQNDRLKDENAIIWTQVFFTIPVTSKWDVLAEYQWRRVDGFKNWQQSLLRTTVQYKLNQQLSFAAGYAFSQTFSYGDYPVAFNGTFPEHRLYEQVQLKNSFGRLSLNQRLRIEQRFVGSRGLTTDIEKWVFSHRFRYLLKLQYPLTTSQKLYAAIADEVFISAGRNVGVNTFDQNRLTFLSGLKITPKFAFEAGYINQTLVQGKRVSNHTIVQSNKGITLALYFQL